ncbi:glycoside hydrolase [Russula brevipes]|nr:glycoside hydrolase [Russula brevipes]
MSGLAVRTQCAMHSCTPTRATSLTQTRTTTPPPQQRLVNSFNGWSLLIIESLDKLWLMDLYGELNGALAVVSNITFTLPPTGVPSSTSNSVGANADSGYEYMLKQWLLSGRTDTKARDLYLRSVNAILDNLTYVSPKRNLLYVTDASVDPDGKIIPTYAFEHLTCFLPGMLGWSVGNPPRVVGAQRWAR